jgi:hypothetical protein
MGTPHLSVDKFNKKGFLWDCGEMFFGGEDEEVRGVRGCVWG